jgi:signal transduction histidine kinase
MDESQSGLGLAIVKALVEAHGGKARAESTAGEGTRIILCLPNA